MPDPHDLIDDPLDAAFEGDDPLGDDENFVLPPPFPGSRMLGRFGREQEVPNDFVDVYTRLSEQQIRQRIATLMMMLLEGRIPLVRCLRLINQECEAGMMTLRAQGAGEEAPDPNPFGNLGGFFRDLTGAVERQNQAQGAASALRGNADAAESIARVLKHTDDPELRTSLRGRLDRLLDAVEPVHSDEITQIPAFVGHPDDTDDDADDDSFAVNGRAATSLELDPAAPPVHPTDPAISGV